MINVPDVNARDVIDLLLTVMHDPRVLTMVLIGIATMATVFTLAMPLLQGDGLGRRMKAVATERGKIRERERERASRNDAVSLRIAPKESMKRIVEQFNLARWLGTDDARLRLTQAGYRANSAIYGFLVMRLVVPIVAFVVAVVEIFFVLDLQYPFMIKVGGCIAAAFLGIKAPEIFLKNAITKRQTSIRRAWPDALDLLLICVDSGMSIEHACRRVSAELGTASVALAEEMSLLTAELSYLPDRRTAYENIAIRTGLDGVKAVTTALIQAERYGTPLGQALRVLAQENRDMRMMEAEKKAARLPPMLTVPMIVFFLPVLFIVIMGPAVIQIFKWT